MEVVICGSYIFLVIAFFKYSLNKGLTKRFLVYVVLNTKIYQSFSSAALGGAIISFLCSLYLLLELFTNIIDDCFAFGVNVKLYDRAAHILNVEKSLQKWMFI